MQIVWTKHAFERQQQWNEGLGITREEVEAAVTNPQRVWSKPVGRRLRRPNPKGPGYMNKARLRGLYTCIGRCTWLSTTYDHTHPQQIIWEDDVCVAQVKRGNGILRVPFVEIGNTKRILTLYWTNQIKRYWQENPHES